MIDRPLPRTMSVIGSCRITPSLLRVTLGGEGMIGYPANQQGAYVKLMLSPGGDSAGPIIRTYTISRQRDGEMDIDFALHEIGPVGPATRWALNANPGDKIALGGPGPAKRLPPGFDYYFIAGDMTALPAISVNVEALPRDAVGFAAIEIVKEGDRRSLDAPPGVEIRWLVNAEPGARPELLEEALRQQRWPDGDVYAWVAGELSTMHRLRSYLRNERGLGGAASYLSSYWKNGLAEEQHKLIKRQDAEAAAS